MRRTRHAFVRHVAASLLVVLLLSGCASRCRGYRDEQSDGDHMLVDARTVAELLDAVETELVGEGLCKGGEELRLAICAGSDDPHVVRLCYSVPGVLTISREAYIQHDGLVVLADDLSFRDRETRWSTRPIDQAAFDNAFRHSRTRIACVVDGALTTERLARQRERQRRKQEAVAQP